MLQPKSSWMLKYAGMIAAAVNVLIIAWNATSNRLIVFYDVSDIVWTFVQDESSHLPGLPVQRICVAEARHGIQLQCTMTLQEVVAMLRREVGGIAGDMC